MTPTEVSNSLSTLMGLWPDPAMADEEARILGFGLSKLEVGDFKRAVNDMMLSPRDKRPNAGTILSQVRFWQRRRLEDEATRTARALAPPPIPDPRPFVAEGRGVLQQALTRLDERRALARTPQPKALEPAP